MLTVVFASSASANISQKADQEELFKRIENAQKTLEALEMESRPRQTDQYQVGQYYPPWYNWGNWNNWDNWPNYWNNWLNY